MTRLLPAAVLLAAVLLAPAPAGAENPDWANALKEFKESFKTKNPLKERRTAAKKLAAANDGRAVKELIKVVSGQDSFAGKIRKEWEKEEAAWQEKTAKFMKAIADRGNQITPEEDDWLGLTEKWQQPGAGAPKMYQEKDRIQGLYKQYLSELELVPYVFECVARLVNGLQGEERSSALRDLVSGASRASGDDKAAFIHGLAFIKGEDAVASLEGFAGDTDSQVVVQALEALGRQNQEKGLTILIKRLEDPRWQVRAGAIKGLSYFKDVRAMDALVAGAKKEAGDVQRKYFAAMARILQEQRPGTPEAWESYWSENRKDYEERWARLPKGEPIEGDPPDIPIDTSLGSTSFYGIRTSSKHIIFVVDISGSMGEGGGKNEQGEQRIDVARKELKTAVQSLSASDEDERGAATFNIVVYADTVTVYKPGKMVVATKSNKEKAVEWIDATVQATGHTNLFDAIEQAFNIIGEGKDEKNLEKGADTLFVMTDGFPNRGKFFDPDLILREVKEMNKTRKLTIHTIGVGQGHNAQFLGALAAQNDGQYLSR